MCILLCMYVYLFRCMSRLGMLIRVTARAVLIEREANFVDPGVLRVLFVVLITGAVPPILVGPRGN